MDIDLWIEWIENHLILIIISLVTLPIILIISIGITDYGFDKGEGVHVGYISEVERSGVIWRPPEVKVININPTYSEQDTVWYYGATEEMAQYAEFLAKHNAKVKVFYRTSRIVGLWQFSHRTIIYNLEEIKTDG